MFDEGLGNIHSSYFTNARIFSEDSMEIIYI